MALINPYLNFNGNTEEAFNFYKSIFGGEFMTLVRFGDMPNPEFPTPENDANKIMHIALPIGKNILMASDSLESMGQKLEKGNNFYISINANSRQEADHLFNGLSTGGKIEMSIADSPWGSYFGMLTDKYNIKWLVDFDPNFNTNFNAL